MQRILLHLIYLFLAVSSMSQELERTKISSEISMKIHSEFVPMNIQQQQTKYISARTPVAMYATMDGFVDLGINFNSTQWGDGSLDILKDFYRASILSLYDRVDFIQDEIRTIDERDFIVFEFVGTVLDDDAAGNQLSLSKYIYIQYTLYKGKVLLFNFSCPVRLQNTWADQAEAMMQSVRLR